MDVVINVEEQSTADVNFGISFGGADFPLSGSVRWNERNFRGSGQILGAGLEVSPVRQTLTLELHRAVAARPALVGRRIELGVERNLVRNVPQDAAAAGGSRRCAQPGARPVSHRGGVSGRGQRAR